MPVDVNMKIKGPSSFKFDSVINGKMNVLLCIGTMWVASQLMKLMSLLSQFILKSHYIQNIKGDFLHCFNSFTRSILFRPQTVNCEIFTAL
jgi:hypothetical protein